MGVIVRAGNYYVNFSHKGQQLRFSTGIPVDGPTEEDRQKNRLAAERIYQDHLRKYKLGRLAPRDEALQQRVDHAPGWCYLYFVRSGQRVKIGRARNLKNRLRHIQTHQAERIELLAAIVAHSSMEREIHKQFKALRVSGEWFDLSGPLLAFIDQLRAGVSLPSLLHAFTSKRIHSHPKTNGRSRAIPPRIRARMNAEKTQEKPKRDQGAASDVQPEDGVG